MLEPRGGLRSTILRGDSVTIEAEASLVESSSAAGAAAVVQYEHHDTPSLPMHPALEYEVLAEKMAVMVCPTEEQHLSDADQVTAEPIVRNSENQVKLLVAFLFLIASGVGTVVSTKLQAIPMYNYPNCLNLFSNLLFIPICFAYIVPASRIAPWPSRSSTIAGSSSSSRRCSSSRLVRVNTATTTGTLQWWPRKRLLKRFAIMGALDSLAMTLQTFAAVYLPGPLLILLPQAAIPVSLALTALTSKQGITWPQWVGAATVLIGIWIVLEPVLLSQHAPDFYCEAADRQNFCTLCQVAVTEEACRATQTTIRPGEDFGFATLRRLQDPPDSPGCRWLPFEESTQEKEFLEIVWSIILMASTVPMALSAIYKQRAMLSMSSPPLLGRTLPQSTAASADPVPQLSPLPSLYVSGWIAVFQLVCSLVLAIPAGLLASPAVYPWNVPENIFNGMLCYAGNGVIETGCHPDTLCASQHAAFWVNATVLGHAVYTVSMMLVLQGSSNSVLLFLALTVIVPLGNLAFTMPFMPHQSQTVVRTADLAGLIVILAGLVLYRFSDPIEVSSFKPEERHVEEGDFWRFDDFDEDENEESFTGLLRSLWPVQNQTSYTLLREPISTGEV